MTSAIIDKYNTAAGKVMCPDINKTGSGFFISNKGHFLTNNHVIHQMHIDDNTGAIRVDYSKRILIKVDQTIYRAKLVLKENADRPIVYDYAILKADTTPNVYFEIAKISEIMQGDKVIALGYPLDFNELIATTGIVSTIISRPSHINSLHRIKTFLTDVLITYGNSGGPLIKASDGKVIGMNTMPHEIRDELRERLQKYMNMPEIKNILPIHDLIEFVLRYTNVGYNYAISIEYVMADPCLEV